MVPHLYLWKDDIKKYPLAQEALLAEFHPDESGPLFSFLYCFPRSDSQRFQFHRPSPFVSSVQSRSVMCRPAPGLTVKQYQQNPSDDVLQADDELSHTLWQSRDLLKATQLISLLLESTHLLRQPGKLSGQNAL